MQTNVDSQKVLQWKKLGNNIRSTHFPSNHSGNVNIFVKRFDALKKDPHRNITIFLLHDLCQHHGRFLAFINWTREHCPGISFVAMDFAGHGLSSGTRGHIAKFDGLVEDFLFLLNHLDRNYDEDEKWIIQGQGLGGLVALDFLNSYSELIKKRIDGLILSNFILKFSSHLLNFEKQLTGVSAAFQKIMAHARPTRILLGEKILSHPQDILLYEQDPLICHRPTLSTISEIQNKVSDIYQDAYFIVRPVLLLKSEVDHAIHSGEIDYFAKGIKKELLTEKKYSFMKHDLYNEGDREIVFQDIMDWIKIYENM